MTTENKNNKVPKTRLSDLTPKKDARAGKFKPDATVRGPGVGMTSPSAASSPVRKKQANL